MKPVKLYLHYCKNDVEHTAVWRAADESNTWDHVCQHFKQSFEKKYPSSKLNKLRLQTHAGELLSANDRVVDSMRKYELSSGADIFVLEAEDTQGPGGVTAAPAAGKSSGVVHTAAKAKPTRTLEATNPSDPAIQQVIEQSLDAAKRCLAARKLRRAREICEQVLQFDPKNAAAARGCARILWERGAWSDALSAYNRLLKLPGGGTPSDWLMLGKLHLKCDDTDSAEDALQRASKAITATSSSSTSSRSSSSSSSRGKITLGLGEKRVSAEDVDCAKGWCAMQAGDAQAASDTFMAVLGRTNESHVEALVGYATLAVLVNQLPAALPPLLKAVVIDQSHKETRQLLAKVLSDSTGLETLWAQVPMTDHSAEVYAFLGGVVKDYSALSTAAALQQKALSQKPDCAAYALALAHCYEAQAKYSEAFAVIKSFLRSNADRAVGSRRSSSRTALTNAAVLAVIADIQELSNPAPGEAQFKLHWVEVPGSNTDVTADVTDGTAVDSGGSSASTSYAYCTAISSDTAETTQQPSSNSGGTPLYGDEGTMHAAHTAQEQDREKYNEQSLDLLALYMTIVKLLYVTGASLAVIPSLARLIEPARLYSAVPLHRTTIRNEQAYYACILQLLAMKPERPLSLLPTATGPPIYVCGDSHTLPLVWNTVTVAGQQRMLVPALVTGLKHWHLRKESVFYPKANFQAVTDSIPVGATVVFIFGEIDCREGLLVAVERARYETLQEGMEVTIGHFIKAVTALIQKRKLRAYIHPVCPVLEPTRPVVCSYNAIYQRAVQSASSSSNGSNGYMRWLDMFADMLEQTSSTDGSESSTAESTGSSSSGSSTKLKPEFVLDGTHLSPQPAYLPLLQRAVEAADARAASSSSST